MTLFLEGVVVCFILLVPCVVAIAYGVERAAFLYEQDVQERVIQMGLVTRERLGRNQKLFKIVTITVLLCFVLWAVYGVNGARGFWQPFWQIWALAMAEGLFDRFFIDWYWVGRTKAWEIPGTEDLKPYIPKKTKLRKWAVTIIGNPLIAAFLAGILFPFFGRG